MKNEIPKIIHYCWFGKNELGEKEKKCIASWKKFFPDYEIKLWNEENYDVSKIPYIKQAYEKKKYAFVSDYVRFDILYHYGGVYFDTDVEVIKDMSFIIENGAFMGCESDTKTISVAPGLGIACSKGLEIYKEILDYYEKKEFVDGRELETVVSIVTGILKKHGLKNINIQQFVADLIIYPAEYFCPLNMFTGKLIITDNTYSIHHYTASWLTEDEKEKMEKVGKLSGFTGIKLARIIVSYQCTIKQKGWKSVWGLTVHKVKKCIKMCKGKKT